MNQPIHTVLTDFAVQPAAFSVYTAPQLWNHPHVSKQMLKAHLDPNSDRASRSEDYIEASAVWIDKNVQLQGKRLCDLGCGPGLYATQFHDRGARVIGLDISDSSLRHAKASAQQNDRSIHYIKADYTTQDIPTQMDVFTLIFCDYCALSPSQRQLLLSRIHTALQPGGHLVMDVHLSADFVTFLPRQVIENNLMNGFWSDGQYVGLLKSFKYEQQIVTLDRYLIIEAQQHWQIYNWLQYFTPSSLTKELEAAGFEVEHTAATLTGERLQDNSPQMAVIAVALQRK